MQNAAAGKITLCCNFCNIDRSQKCKTTKSRTGSINRLFIIDDNIVKAIENKSERKLGEK